MARKNKVAILDMDASIENGFKDGDIVTDNVVSSFNFSGESFLSSATIKAFNLNTADPTSGKLTDNRKVKTEANISTP